MVKCKLLLKIMLLNFSGINKFIYSKDKSERNRLLLVGISLLVIAVSMGAYSAATAISCVRMGFTDIIPALSLVACAGVTLGTVFIKSNGVLFGFRDYDMIMSLPVSVATIITSRVISVYMLNFLFICIALLPALIVFGINTAASAAVWVMIVLLLFLAPLLPLIIAMFLGAFITAFSIRFRYSNLLTVLLSSVAILLMFFYSFNLGELEASDLTAIGNAISNRMNKLYPPSLLVSRALIDGDVVSFVLFALVSIVPTVVFVFLLSMFYKKINSALFSYRSRGDYKLTTLKTSTPFKALYIKEIRRLITSPIYLLNSSIGAALLIAFSVAMVISDPSDIETALGIPGFMDWGKDLFPLVISVFISISSTTASSISLEGKNIWIPLSLPLHVKTIFNAKIAVNLTTLIPSVFISSCLIASAVNTGFNETILLFVVPIAYSFFISILGLFFNLKFPKLDWTSEQQAVKQSLSVLATMGCGFISVLLPFLLAFRFPEFKTGIFVALAFLLVAVSWFIYEKGLASRKLTEIV